MGCIEGKMGAALKRHKFMNYFLKAKYVVSQKDYHLFPNPLLVPCVGNSLLCHIVIPSLYFSNVLGSDFDSSLNA